MTPLLYVDGIKAITDGCSLFNPETEKDIPNSEAENCIVILDGQHRYMAALESKLDLNNLIVYKDYTKASTKELLSVTNTDSFSWNGGDMVKGASLFSPENEVAQFASQLVDKGYSHSTIGYILCFAGGKLTKTHYSRIMRGEMIEVEYNVKRAEDFLNSARKIFDDKFIKMRYLISAIADLTNKSQGDYSKWLVALEQLDEDDKNSIKKASSDNKNSEIKELEADIVEFADLGDYINQPVKTYSSGMKSRLGFAVNVNIKPEILIIDEALSVGDAVFRKKCLDKVNSIMESKDVTLLFVTHSMATAKKFCRRGIVLKNGTVMHDSGIEEAVDVYNKMYGVKK
jgi:ABC-type dipeptide/oligopeptide/nickel transport system ATPase component